MPVPIPSASTPTPQGPAPLEGAEFRVLMALGLQGVLAGQWRVARQLFDVLASLRPGQPYPLVGAALARMAGGEGAAALRLLEQAQTLAPGEALVQVMLGLALQGLGQNARSAKLLSSVAAQPLDVSARELARQLLNHPVIPRSA